ncbi:MAG: hypothetical protein ACI9DK_002621 [Vicingaceae bacterium]|jgi:hypothetical protein
MSRTLRKSKSSYFFDLIIIIAGITVSFVVNEWREGKKLETKKEQLLLDISKDLYADSLVLDKIITHYKTMARSHDSLLKYQRGTVDEDSLNIYLDHFTSYIPFNPTANTYKRINSDPEMNIQRKDSLIWHYLNLHNTVYPGIKEWFYVEKEFVLKTGLPYMDQHAPYIYPSPVNYSFDGKVFYELRKKDEFMNYLKSGRVYKSSMITIYEQGYNYVKFIKANVRTQITVQKTGE